jgi:Ca-activated chloride channel family protein
LAVTAGVAGAADSESENPLTFSVQSQLVQIYFTVTDGARRVTDLQPGDVTLTEDGKAVAFERLDSETVPLQIALLFDVSESMRDSLEATQEAAIAFVDSLQPADRVTVVFFNSDIRCVSQHADDRTLVLQAIRESHARGGTKLYDALLFAMKQLDGKQGRKAIVAFSDGEDTARTSSLNLVLNAARRYGFPIYTIGAGSGLKRDSLKTVLRQLSTQNGAKAFFVKDPRRLQHAFAEVSSELRSAYVLNYYTAVPSDGRWHDLQITLRDPSRMVHSRNGFLAKDVAAANGDEPPAELAKADPKEASVERPRVMGPIAARAADRAQTEMLRVPAAMRELPTPESLSAGNVEPPAAQLKPDLAAASQPVFKVESRFVEVPVLIESSTEEEIQKLEQRDFRVYEDEALKEIVFFKRAGDGWDLPRLRSAAMQQVRKPDGDRTEIAESPQQELLLGRYLILLDNMMSETGAFLRAKQAAETLIGKYRHPLRRVSLHLTSEPEATLNEEQTPEGVLERLRDANQQANSELTGNDSLMTVHEAYLIERGERQAREVAELRYASSLRLSFRNELGEVQGQQPGSPEMIRAGVQNATRILLSENSAQVSRTIDGLRAAVAALANYPGNYPRVLILISSGFVLGQGSGRADLTPMLQDAIELAKRSGVRIFTIDASGVAPTEVLGLRADGAFLVQNPHLHSILYSHARDWQGGKEASLAELARTTGGKFLNNSNDLSSLGERVLRTTGELYYLGYLSHNPADGKFHRIRVTSSLGSGARLYTRQGYVAGPASHGGATREAGEPAIESPPALLQQAERARASGNLQAFAGAMEKLSRKFPSQPSVWFNLGAAHLTLKQGRQAVEAFQRARLLAPEDREIALQLSKAHIAAGDSASAADVLEDVVRSHPEDIDALIQLGRVYESDFRMQDAYQSYRKVLDLMLGPPLEIYLLLARTSMSIGRKVEAELFMQDYLERGGDPASLEPYRTLARN